MTRATLIIPTRKAPLTLGEKYKDATLELRRGLQEAVRGLVFPEDEDQAAYQIFKVLREARSLDIASELATKIVNVDHLGAALIALAEVASSRGNPDPKTKAANVKLMDLIMEYDRIN